MPLCNYLNLLKIDLICVCPLLQDYVMDYIVYDGKRLFCKASSLQDGEDVNKRAGMQSEYETGEQGDEALYREA